MTTSSQIWSSLVRYYLIFSSLLLSNIHRQVLAKFFKQHICIQRAGDGIRIISVSRGKCVEHLVAHCYAIRCQVIKSREVVLIVSRFIVLRQDVLNQVNRNYYKLFGLQGENFPSRQSCSSSSIHLNSDLLESLHLGLGSEYHIFLCGDSNIC